MNASVFAKFQRQDELFSELLSGRNPSELSDKEIVRIGRMAEALAEAMAENSTLTPAQEQALAQRWLARLTFQIC